MKAHIYTAFLVLLPGYFFDNNAQAQNIRGDTIFVNANSVTAVVFPSILDKAELSGNNNSEGLYEVNAIVKKTLAIKALKKDARDQALEVTEGGRKHVFILSYKEGTPARSIDLSTKKKLSVLADKAKKDVNNALDAANNSYAIAKSNISNQALWSEAEAKYQRLLLVAEGKEAGVVKSRLEEIRQNVQSVKEKRYGEAIREGENYFTLKKFEEARKAYQTALEQKPGDLQTLKYLNVTDSLWAKDYAEKGDEAYKAKKIVLAKSHYGTALNIKPDYPGLQNKFNQTKKEADPLIFKIEQEKGNEAMKANDFEEARRAYDSALAVNPDSKYIRSQLVKLIAEEEKIEQEEEKEDTYQRILATAKSIADKATSVQDYDLAIKEYERALFMSPTRKFPKKKIGELSRIKNSVRAN